MYRYTKCSMIVLNKVRQLQLYFVLDQLDLNSTNKGTQNLWKMISISNNKAIVLALLIKIQKPLSSNSSP